MEKKSESRTGGRAKPFVKWAGGKSGLLPVLDTLLPDAGVRWEETTYVEPFVGGGAMLFHVLRKFPRLKRAVAGDINGRLAACYRTVRDRPGQLTERLRRIQERYYAMGEAERKDYFLEQRGRLNEGIGDETEQTAVFLLLNRTCFNGLYRVNRRGLFNVPFGRYARPLICDEETIAADSRLLQRVEVAEGDFERVAAAAGGRLFCYLDPPYRPVTATASFTAYDGAGFGDSDQLRLKALCDRLHAAGHLFMLSNSDSRASTSDPGYFDRLYAAYRIHRTRAPRAISRDGAGRGSVPEIVVRNY